jgi:hypothetical protein
MRLVAHFLVFILGIFLFLYLFLTGQAVGFEPGPDGKTGNIISKIRQSVKRVDFLPHLMYNIAHKKLEKLWQTK